MLSTHKVDVTIVPVFQQTPQLGPHLKIKIYFEVIVLQRFIFLLRWRACIRFVGYLLNSDNAFVHTGTNVSVSYDGRSVPNDSISSKLLWNFKQNAKVDYVKGASQLLLI